MAVYLIRHAKATSRDDWDGDEIARPLTEKGRAQADALADVLADTGIERVLSSPAVRCVQTVQPLADRVGVSVEDAPELGEGEPVGPARRLVEGLASQDAALSAHGDLIPALLDVLATEGMALDGPRACKKGSTWVLDAEDGCFVRGRYVGPPEVSR